MENEMKMENEMPWHEKKWHEKALTTWWVISLVLMGACVIVFAFVKGVSLESTGNWQILILLTLAFFAEYIDSSLGMGYGTTLTPLLLILGFSPLQIVPAVLLSECLSGISSGLLHHKAGNVDLSRGTDAHKTMRILAACSVVGGVLAVMLALQLPKFYVKLYIGGMVTLIGLAILFGKTMMGAVARKKIAVLGSVAAFNKGISGGGYGPLLTGGQILAGVPEKEAIGITSFAEGIVCFVGLGLYLIFHGAPYWGLALPLSIGAMLSVPMAILTVKVLPTKHLRRTIGFATLFLGTMTLAKVLI